MTCGKRIRVVPRHLKLSGGYTYEVEPLPDGDWTLWRCRCSAPGKWEIYTGALYSEVEHYLDDVVAEAEEQS